MQMKVGVLHGPGDLRLAAFEIADDANQAAKLVLQCC